MKYVFGPVQSRRLGLSLGVDPIGAKTCTLDCVYCQLGATGHRTLERRPYVPANKVLDEIRTIIASEQTIDYITFSGTGEPTLNSELGPMIAQIKAISDLPVAVITNSTLLHLKEVQKDLMQADLVVPSIDAISPQAFARINRPHLDIDLTRMLNGLETFSSNYTGRLWLEVMLVQDVNDSQEELQALADFVKRIACEKIQINTVTRPPSESNCTAVSNHVLEQARELFGPRSEIIGSISPAGNTVNGNNPAARILALVRSHPCTLEQICTTLGLNSTQANAALQELISRHDIKRTEHDGNIFYRALGR